MAPTDATGAPSSAPGAEADARARDEHRAWMAGYSTGYAHHTSLAAQIDALIAVLATGKPDELGPITPARILATLNAIRHKGPKARPALTLEQIVDGDLSAILGPCFRRRDRRYGRRA